MVRMAPPPFFDKTAAPLSVIRASLALKRTRTGQLLSGLLQGGKANIPTHWGGMKMFLEQQITEHDPRLERVYANFESNYRDLLALAENTRVPVLFSTVAVNLAHSAPFASTGPVPTTLDHARQLAITSKWDSLAQSAATLVSESPAHAEAHYLHGLAQLHTGEVDAAKASFQRACDLDTLRFRADSRINAIIRSLPAKSAHFVDAEAHLKTLSPDGIPGGKFFFEHVHFTPDGNHAVAKLLAPICETVLRLTATSESWLSLDQCMTNLGSSPFHQRELYQEVRARVSGAPFTNQFGHAARLAELDLASRELDRQLDASTARQTVEHFDSLIALRPDDWQTRDKYAVLLDSLGALTEIVAQRQAIADLLPHDAAAHSQLGSAFNRVEKWSKAEHSLRRAIALREQHPKAWNSLGISLSRQPERSEEAVACFSRAVILRPDYAEAFFNWGLIVGNQGQLQTAVHQFQAAIVADRHYTPAYQSLGQALVKLKRFEAAVDAYAQLTELVPDDPNTHLNHGLACLQVHGSRAAAIQSLRTVLKLDPKNAIATKTLASMEVAP